MEGDRLLSQVMALQWVQGRLQDLVINNEGKEGHSEDHFMY